MREISFDTETTGLDPFSGHRIIEIGCVEIIDKRITGNNYHIYIQPERDVPKAATQVHGITDEFLSDKPKFNKIAQDFLDFVGNDKLVIHNAAFDMKFINYELERVNKKPLPYEQAIDTLAIARKKFPGAKATLDALCSRFGISLERRDKHGALLDAELLADMYLEMIGERQSSLHLSSSKTIITENNNKNWIEPRKFTPTSEEIITHNEFLENNIKDSLWNKLN